MRRAGAHLNSKIEFSARHTLDPEIGFELARTDIGRDAGLRAVRAQHYLAPAAIRQKIRVLAERKQTEPRDVFDLDLLIAQYPPAIRPGDIDASLAQRAAAAAFSISYDAYRELVVDFLEDEFVKIYEGRDVWEEMVVRVVEYLEKLQ